MLANTGSQACEIAICCNEAETVEAPAVEQIHGVDHHGNVGGILAAHGWEMLWQNSEVGLHASPVLHFAPAEIAVDAANRGLAKAGNLFK